MPECETLIKHKLFQSLKQGSWDGRRAYSSRKEHISWWRTEVSKIIVFGGPGGPFGVPRGPCVVLPVQKVHLDGHRIPTHTVILFLPCHVAPFLWLSRAQRGPRAPKSREKDPK